MDDIRIQSCIHGVDRQNGIRDTKMKTLYCFYGENYPKVNNVSGLINEFSVISFEGSVDMVNAQARQRTRS